jgi:hypothetical protein
VHSGKALDVAAVPPTQGTKVHTWDKHCGENQQWVMTGNQIKLKNHNLCLDCQGGGKGPGTKVIAWPHHGGPNQQWDIIPVQGQEEPSSKAHEKCARDNCNFLVHTKQGHNYCCNKCKNGGGHGPACEKRVSDAELIIHEARYGWASDIWGPKTCS